MHILPAAPKIENKLDEFALSKLPLKKQQQIKKRTEAAASFFNWNSLYMSVRGILSPDIGSSANGIQGGCGYVINRRSAEGCQGRSA